MARAYYNERDPYAAAWLERLIAAGEIAPGDVDTRDILDVLPSDLDGYTQCHFFAGVGVWSRALRCAGWPDDRPVWTGSCPCQPFSAAGAGLGVDDDRHLFPGWQWLIEQQRPETVFGEQVASRDGLAWADLVQAAMEASDYACGFVDTCAAGFRSFHIRQRLYFASHDLRPAASGVGHADGARGAAWLPETVGRGEGVAEIADHGGDRRTGSGAGRSEPVGLDNPAGIGCAQAGRGQSGEPEGGERGSELGRGTGELGDAGRVSGQRKPGGVSGAQASSSGARGRDGRHGDGHSNASTSGQLAHFARDGRGEERADGGGVGPGNGAQGRAAGPEPSRDAGRLADPDGRHPGAEREQRGGQFRQFAPVGGGGVGDIAADPSDGWWRDADWLFCRDGKWRPVEPGTFPLADAAPARLGRLRAYGNGLDLAQATAFIRAYLSRDVGRADIVPADLFERML